MVKIVKYYSLLSQVPSLSKLLSIDSLSYLYNSMPKAVQKIRTTLEIMQDYYCDLLIIQYKRKPKARATIAELVKSICTINSATGNLLLTDIENAFDPATAVGVQLDIVGMYVGVDRLYKTSIFADIKAFAFLRYSNTEPNEFQCGFNDYSNFNTNGGIFAKYSNFISGANSHKLNDDDYRRLIMLKIAKNNSNGSYAQVDEIFFNAFGNSVRVSADGGMRMLLYCDFNMLQFLQIAISKDVLPRPTCVNYSGIVLNSRTDIPKSFFALRKYDSGGSLYDPVTSKGLNTYSTFDSNGGKFLKNNDIISVGV